MNRRDFLHPRHLGRAAGLVVRAAEESQTPAPPPPPAEFALLRACPRPGLEINLGSIGKGYALDRVAALLGTEYGTPAALLHGGHSSVYAIGTEPGDARGWAVGLRHPWNPDRRLAVVRLRDRALATSAATFQPL